MKNLRLSMLLMILFVLLAIALPIIGSEIYKSFTSADTANNVTLFFHESGQTKTMTHDDYLLGVLLPEADKDYSAETLRAAVIATRSACLYLKGACRELCGVDSDYCSCSSSLTYFDREEFIKNHVNDGENIVSQLTETIRDTRGEILLYQNSYALALIHRSSHITTESAFDVFGRQYPYLEPVITSEKAEINEIFVLEGELVKKLGALLENKDISEISPSPVLKLNGAGRVENVNIFMHDIPAREFSELFGLKSMCFEIEDAYGGIVIRTYGEGNGVGLSLAGAEKMSKDGFSYRDILLYYFRGCKIVSENIKNAK